MASKKEHISIAKEQYAALLDELAKKRYSVASECAFKTVAQAIEAFLAEKGMHCKDHFERKTFIEQYISPKITELYRELYTIYRRLGYEGRNGKEARRAFDICSLVLIELRKEGITLE